MVLLAPAAGTATGVRLAPCKTFGLYLETGFRLPDLIADPLRAARYHKVLHTQPGPAAPSALPRARPSLAAASHTERVAQPSNTNKNATRPERLPHSRPAAPKNRRHGAVNVTQTRNSPMPAHHPRAIIASQAHSANVFEVRGQKRGATTHPSRKSTSRKLVKNCTPR